MRICFAITAVFGLCVISCAQDHAAATKPIGHFPFLEVDAAGKTIRVECEAIDCRNPLEFFCCSAGTNEHESVLRSKVKPSHLHAALLMLGLTPGEPVHFSEAKQAWLPPHGPPLRIEAQFERDGKAVAVPAYRLMRDLRSKREMPPMTWIFAGSRVLDSGVYAADQTGYIVSVVNFDLTLIDIPKLASNADETLEWETNTALMPPAGTKVTMVISPAGKVEAPATQASAGNAPVDQTLITIDADGTIRVNDIAQPSQMLPRIVRDLPKDARVRVAVANAVEENDVARQTINELAGAGIKFQVIPQAAALPTKRPGDQRSVRGDDEMIRRLREKWDQSVAPHGPALRDAASTHYQVIAQLRAEQQRLIDEADKIQRLIDELEKRYQEMTTPQPPSP